MAEDDDEVQVPEGNEIPDAELDDIKDAENNTDDTPTDDNGEATEYSQSHNPMKIVVRAKPGVKRVYIKETTDLFVGKAPERRFEVAVNERAIDGNANRAIEEALAEHFKVARSNVRIVAGHSAKEKIVEIKTAA